MNQYLELTDDKWVFGSYYREQFLQDTLYKFYFYKDIEFILDRENSLVRDGFAQKLYEMNLIGETVLEACEKNLSSFFDQLEWYDQWSLEQIYGSIRRIRKQYLGAGTIEKAYIESARARRRPGDGPGIDQSAACQMVLKRSEAVLLCLTDPEYFSVMEQDIDELIRLKKKVYVINGTSAGDAILTREAYEELLGQDSPVDYLTDKTRYSGLDLSGIRYSKIVGDLLKENKASLIVYGDDGLFHCRNLNLPSLVKTVPSCYYAKALAGQFVEEKFCTIYVPPHFDILPFVPLREKTRLSYQQLAQLEKRYGMEIYEETIETLYEKYPDYFFNIYEEREVGTLPVSMEDDGEDEPGMEEGSFYDRYCIRREHRITAYLNQFPGIRYISSYLDPQTLEEIPVSWENPFHYQKWEEGETAIPPGTLVQGVIVKQARCSKVIVTGDRACSPRELLWNRREKGLLLISNFLFFLTPKLAAFYNALRWNRPREQIWFESGHLDYMLRYEDEKRIETFPLYNKACVGMKDDGSFLFFQYLLGGGEVRIGTQSFRWNQSDVNPADARGKLCIYTPYRSWNKTEEDEHDYCEAVGEGRLNVIVIQNQMICARRGDVLLPCLGVVLSFEESEGEALMQQMGAEALEDGYYDCRGREVRVHLDPPAGIALPEWEKVCWSYGGGMTLVRDGACICSSKGESGWLKEEGWLGPLSKQTQESEIHKSARHPRTAVGVTEDGELFVLVFSGRTGVSGGADYEEMGKIAKRLVPGIRHMMNVDGGGSAVFGMALDQVFMELSYPATSCTSPAGMVRRINTMLYLKQ